MRGSLDARQPAGSRQPCRRAPAARSRPADSDGTGRPAPCCGREDRYEPTPSDGGVKPGAAVAAVTAAIVDTAGATVAVSAAVVAVLAPIDWKNPSIAARIALA